MSSRRKRARVVTTRKSAPSRRGLVPFDQALRERAPSRRVGTPLDQALLKMEALIKLVPPSWLFMYGEQLVLLKDIYALLLEEALRQKVLCAEEKR